jgi:hypothetical protein
MSVHIEGDVRVVVAASLRRMIPPVLKGTLTLTLTLILILTLTPNPNLNHNSLP